MRTRRPILSRCFRRSRAAALVLALFLAALVALPGTGLCHDGGHGDEGGGPVGGAINGPVAAEVRFPNSGAPEAQAPFLRGVIALHNFWYEEAARAFRAAQEADADFLMAYWGEAMTYSHPLWGDEDPVAARAALARLAPTPADRAALARTTRERLYLAAVESLFGKGGRGARHRAYEQAMADLAARFPDDVEARVFHALSILGLDDGDGEASERDRLRAAAILETVFHDHPRHPGAVHYLIHAYDDPRHARLALPAARAYERIAARAPHALHMPSHIYIQLGLWDDAWRANVTAYDASVAWVAREGLGDAHRDFHSLEWLHFLDLQLGRLAAARDRLAEARRIRQRVTSPILTRAIVRMETRAAADARAWASVPFPRGGPYIDRSLTYGNALFAAGLGAADRGDAAGVSRARDVLIGLERSAVAHGRSTWAAKLAAMRQAVAAAWDFKVGRREKALAAMRAAVAADDTVAAPRGPANPVVPARELHGEMLLALDQPAEAARSFEAELGRHARRPAAVLGLARALARLGRRDEAAGRYREVLEILKKADPGTAAVAEARAFLGKND